MTADDHAPAAFPDADALCERCGYPLRDLPPDGDCPECGLPVAASDPAPVRMGPPWQHRRSAGAWLRTVAGAFRHPRHGFRRMTLAGPNRPPRAFALVVAVVVGAGWFLLDAITRTAPLPRAAAGGIVVALLCLGLTYLEVLGIWFFSSRHGWRVPLRLSERLVCYAAAGWLVALPLAWGLWAVAGWTLHTGAWLILTRPLAGWSLVIAWAVALFAVVLPFELLVYFGVRQVRYANAPPEAGHHQATKGERKRGSPQRQRESEKAESDGGSDSPPRRLCGSLHPHNLDARRAPVA